MTTRDDSKGFYEFTKLMNERRERKIEEKKAEIEKRGKRIIEKAMEIWNLSNIAEPCCEPLF